MAQRSRSSRSSRSSGSSRGGRRPSARSAPVRRSGGNGPTIAAALIVVGVLGAVVYFAAQGNSRKPTPPPIEEEMLQPAPVEVGPDGKPRMPPPQLPAQLKEQAQELVREARGLRTEAEAIYKVANDAKKAGDEDLWQEKLREAAAILMGIKDGYNDLIGEMPHNDDWDEEQVANHYLGAEADSITRAMQRLIDIQKQRRR